MDSASTFKAVKLGDVVQHAIETPKGLKRYASNRGSGLFAFSSSTLRLILLFLIVFGSPTIYILRPNSLLQQKVHIQTKGSGDDVGDIPIELQNGSLRFSSELYQHNLERLNELAHINECNIDHPLYTRIEDDLASYESSGISDEMILLAHEKCSDNVLLEIENGKIVSQLPKLSSIDSRGRMTTIVKSFERFAGWLPDMKFVINLMDEPCGWIAPIPEEDERSLEEGRATVRDVWKKHGCNVVGYEEMKDLHGFFVNPSSFTELRAKVPIWSIYSLPGGCFSDLMSSSIHTPGPSDRCPPPNSLSLRKKNMKAIFRGSTTGGVAFDDTPEADIEKFQRLRLVEVSKSLNRSDIDVGVTGYVQCAPEQCDRMRERWGLAEMLPQDAIFDYAMQIMVDGNGAVNRQGPTMCSGSVMLKAKGLEEWYYKGVRPWQEYLPLDLSYDNLGTLVDWVEAHVHEAEKIALNAARFAAQYLRLQEQQCYAAKLAVEYTRLYEKWKVGSGAS